MSDLIERDWVLKRMVLAPDADTVRMAPAVGAEPVITGETSDGYHTFNELYHHRAVLFSVIVKAFEDKAWKSRKHHDGTMYDGMFIVGVETPNGQATYHYDMEPYWEMFCCKEIERAPEWDGHTPAQAIERIGKLEPMRHGCNVSPAHYSDEFTCSACGFSCEINELRYDDEDGFGMGEANLYEYDCKYCPNCGAKMDGGKADD